jgi:hypothetical protein
MQGQHARAGSAVAVSSALLFFLLGTAHAQATADASDAANGPAEAAAEPAAEGVAPFSAHLLSIKLDVGVAFGGELLAPG